MIFPVVANLGTVSPVAFDRDEGKAGRVPSMLIPRTVRYHISWLLFAAVYIPPIMLIMLTGA